MAISLSAKAITPLSILTAIMCFFYGYNVSAKEYIVKLKHGIEDYDLSQLSIATNYSLKLIDKEPDLNLLKISTQTQSLADAEATVSRYLNIDYIVENVKLHSFMRPSDPKIAEQWYLETIDMFNAWNTSLGSHNVVVAVIDTGIDMSHEDLSSNIWTNPHETANGLDDDDNGYVDDLHGWDFHAEDKDPTDETSSNNPGHGTHCSGIIGAHCNNHVGICGISPQVSIMPLRFLGSDGSGDLFASVKAIQYAQNAGAHIISASWGANIPADGAQPLVDAIKSAEEKGVIFIAAAGNEGKSNDNVSVYPANASTRHMISVAASNSSDEKPYWSNYGRKVDIAAPGENIVSTLPSDYGSLSGTSMATPMVAGLVALMKSLDDSLSGEVTRSILQSTGKKVSIATASKRRIDASAATQAVVNKQLTVVPAAYTLAPGGEFDFSAWGGNGAYRFRSLNPDIATITEAGHLVALKEGEVAIEVTDSANNKAQSVSILVGTASDGGGGSCPLPNEMLCMIACIISPELPWCSDTTLPDLPLPELPELP